MLNKVITTTGNKYAAIMPYIIFAFTTLFSLPAAQSQPLQGSVEQNRIHIPEEVDALPPEAPRLKGLVQHSGIIDSRLFASQVPEVPLYALPPKQPITGKTEGGKDEYWVDWNAWERRVNNYLYVLLVGQIGWGGTRVGYDVTRDGRISITSIKTPDPTHKSGKMLAKAILSLQGNHLLTFPSGSHQMIHHAHDGFIGLPVPLRLSHSYQAYEAPEHITKQGNQRQ